MLVIIYYLPLLTQDYSRVKYCHPTFYPVFGPAFRPPLFPVFPEAERAVVAELSPEVVVWAAESEVVFVVVDLSPEVQRAVAAELSPEVVVWAVKPEAEHAVVAEPEVVFVAAELSLEVVVWAVEPEAEHAVVAEPEVVFVAVEPEAVVVSEPQVSVDIAVASVVLVPVFVVVVGFDSSGRPRFLVFPNVDYFASSSSSV
jgi:hypothetical protein